MLQWKRERRTSMLQILPLCLKSLQLPTFSLDTVYMNMYIHKNTSHWLLTRVNVDQDRNSPPCLLKTLSGIHFWPVSIAEKSILILLVHIGTIGTYWSILVHIGTYWSILVRIGTYWYILVIGTYWYKLVLLVLVEEEEANCCTKVIIRQRGIFLPVWL